MPELIQELLIKRGVTTDEAQEIFLHPDYDRDTHDPFLLTDMDKAVSRLIKAIQDKEYIALYSDFDADGIPAGALLHDTLQKIGHARFTNYIPHRDTQGYGFHSSAVDELHEKGVTLIVTVDVGIMGHEAVAHARDRGIDVIVTDHHLPGETLPDALAVVNPQRLDDSYPFPHLCGSGVAYKMVQALFIHARKEKVPWVENVPVGWEKWLLDLVAIATVGDMMELTGENRVLVSFGLQVLHKGRRRGLLALYRKLGLQQWNINEDDIGFSIAPRINASSRMGSPETAFTLLTTQDDGEAKESAKLLEQLNNKRKGTVAHMVKELKERFQDSHDEMILVAGNPEWNPALLGLAANSLVDTFHKTACLWGRDGSGMLKGSCRSSGEVPIVDLFKALGDTLLQFGGHAYAGGFAVSPDAVHTLSESCNAVYEQVRNEHVDDDSKKPDASLAVAHLQQSYHTLQQLAPFGMSNPKPLFIFTHVAVQEVRQFGKEELHFEIQISHDAQDAQSIRGIAFFKQADSFTREPHQGDVVDVVATLACSRFAGRTRYELHVIDIQ